MTQKLWRLGVAGLGTVGAGLLKFLEEQPDFAPAGGRAQVVGVTARSRSRPRPVDISAIKWFDDPAALAASPDVDVFVELIGGSDGVAKVAVETALSHGKPVVTANKALLATHGLELARLAESTGAPLLFEAAVMGGTPAVKMLREAMVGDEVMAVAGILNGTCNYILTEMEALLDRGGQAPPDAFGAVLAEAQRIGYAEADPTMDIGGFDAGHKITLLAALAFGKAPNFSAAEIEGVDAVELLDIRMARDLGYRIKLVAAAVREADGVSVRVYPALARLNHPLSQTSGALNALFIEGRRIGRIFVQGPGAGAGPTAAAVAADIADVMAGAKRPVFQRPAQDLKPFAKLDPARHSTRAYIRLLVRDQPGVIAAVSEAIAEAGLSIDSFLQKPVEDAGGVPIVLTTHEAPEDVLRGAVEHISKLDAVVAPPRMLRIAPI
jgi:homoserine dehydrogenase